MDSFDPLLLERAKQVRLLALDVDGVLTDGRLYFDSAGNELKAFSTRDGLGIKALQRFDIGIAIITGRSSPMVSARATQLSIEHVYQGSDDKLTAYEDLLRRTGLEDRDICYVGDDWIDLPVLARCGLAVTVPSADAAVRDRVHWVTDRAGGDGAVREVCELILHAQDHYDSLLESFAAQ